MCVKVSSKMSKLDGFNKGELSAHFVDFGSGVQINLKTDCWGPCKSKDTHIVEFSEKSADFFVWSLKALGAKIWTQGLNPL